MWHGSALAKDGLAVAIDADGVECVAINAACNHIIVGDRIGRARAIFAQWRNVSGIRIGARLAAWLVYHFADE